MNIYDGMRTIGRRSRNRRPPGGSGRRPAAALLNGTGLSAGYLYLRRRRRAVVTAGVTTVLVLAAALWKASLHPAVWIPVLACWLAWLTVDGWRCGRKVWPEPLGGHGPARPWLPFAVAGLVLAVEAAGVLTLRDAAGRNADRAYAAQASGACERTADSYGRVASGVYELTFAPGLEEAHFDAESCRMLVRAEGMAADAQYAEAASGYESYLERYPNRPVWQGAVGRWAELRLSYAGVLADQAVARAGALAKAHRLFSDEPGLEERLAADALSKALARYQALSQELPATAAARRVPEAVDDLYRRATVPFAEKRYCESWGPLRAFTLLVADPDAPGSRTETRTVAATAAKSLPRALYECGAGRFKQKDYGEARNILEGLVSSYPDSPLGTRATDMITVSRIKTIQGGDTGDLPPPSKAGRAASGTVTVTVVNDSDEALEILYAGPDTGTAQVKECPGCDGGSRFDDCSADGSRPSVRLKLAPGTYDVVVTTPGANVTPFSGSWRLTSGSAYEECYYISVF